MSSAVTIVDSTGPEEAAAPAVPMAQEKLSEQQKRLKKLMEVNRKLHSTLAAKKILAAQLKKGNEEMMQRLEARELEEMGRHRQLQELQAKLQREQTSQQAETLQLQKAVMGLEEKIEHITEENHELNERHKQSKATIAEQQSTIKHLTRRTKELSRHIEFMSGHLHEAVTADGDTHGGLDGGRSIQGSEMQHSPTRQSPRRQKGDKPKRLSEFKRLPGLDLELLLGADAMSILNPDRPTTPNDADRAPSPAFQRPTSRSNQRRTSRGQKGGAKVPGVAAGADGGGAEGGQGGISPDPEGPGRLSGAAADESAAANARPVSPQPTDTAAHQSEPPLQGHKQLQDDDDGTNLQMLGGQRTAPADQREDD